MSDFSSNDEQGESPSRSHLPFPVMKPFAFIVKGYRSDGMDRHGIWEIVAYEGTGDETERAKIRRIATARLDCPLAEVWDVNLQNLRDDAELVGMESFRPRPSGL